MNDMRMRFIKEGRAVYISHLDLMRTMQRAFFRAGYELKYSEGFNPHPRISVLQPLSVGCSSQCELMDFSLSTDISDNESFISKINEALPEGIRVTEVYAPQNKPALMKYMLVQGTYEYDSVVPDCADRLRGFYSRSQLYVLRKTKRGESEFDLTTAFSKMKISEGGKEGSILLECIISVNDPVLNPELLKKALDQLVPELSPDFASFRRIETYDSGMNVFR